MRLASDILPATAPHAAAAPILGEESAATTERYADYKIIRRNGAVVGFEPDKIAVAVTKAYLAVSGNTAAASASIRDKVRLLTQTIVSLIPELAGAPFGLHGPAGQRLPVELFEHGLGVEAVHLR